MFLFLANHLCRNILETRFCVIVIPTVALRFESGVFGGFLNTCHFIFETHCLNTLCKILGEAVKTVRILLY